MVRVWLILEFHEIRVSVKDIDVSLVTKVDSEVRDHQTRVAQEEETYRGVMINKNFIIYVKMIE